MEEKKKNKVVFIEVKILTGHKYRHRHTLEKLSQHSTSSSNTVNEVTKFFALLVYQY